MSYIIESIPQEELDAFMANVRSGPQGQGSDRISFMDTVIESPSRSQRWAIDRSVPAALFRWFGGSSGFSFAFFIKDKFYEFEGRRLGGVLPAMLRFSTFFTPLNEEDKTLVERELKRAFYIHGEFGLDRTNDPNYKFELITEIEFQYPPYW